MHARVFRRITKRFSTISKTALVALFLFVVTFGIAGTVLAQATPQDPYYEYKNLFSNSSFIYSGPLVNKTEKKVTGLQFKFTINFPANNTASVTKAWERVTDPDGDYETFIIESCLADGTGSCAYARIPFEEAPTASTVNNLKRYFNYASYIIPIRTGVTVYNFITGQDGVTTRLSEEYGVEVNQSLNNSLVVFKKGANGNYLQSREVDILATNWFQLNGSEYNVDNWLQTKSRSVTVWYCAKQSSDDIDPRGAFQAQAAINTQEGLPSDPAIKTFGSLCSGNSYFKVAPTIQVTPPQAFDDAVQQNAGIIKADPTRTIESGTNLPECNFETIIGCLARLVYYGLYWPLAWVAGLFGSLFDFFIGYSVSDESYRYAFAVNGWKLVRDIANVMFIIIMVYVGFAAVFNFGGKGGSTMKKVVPILIFNALIINFSLFATRTVIDVSNITARVFYSRMVVCEGECRYAAGSSTPENIKRGLGGHWPLSEKITSAFDPQRMFNTAILTPKETVTNAGHPNDPLTNNTAVGREAATQQQKGFNRNSNEYAGYYALVSIIAAGIMFGIAAMFFKVAFMFVGRVIGLYMAMIFSPFAFLTQGGMPLFKIKEYTWDAWVKDLFNYAALAPVFTFFLYIIYSFLNTDIVEQIGVKDTSGGFFGTVLSIVIPMLFIYFLISKGVDVAKRYSGDFGDKMQQWGQVVTGAVGGAALGVATGGTALVGRNVVGRLGNTIANSEWLRNRAASGNAITRRFADTTLRAGSSLANATYDARNTQLARRVERETGMQLNNRITSLTGTGTANTAGGFRGAITRNERVLNDRANRLQTTGAAAANMNSANEAWEREYQARRRTAEQAALGRGDVFNEEQFRFRDMRAQAAAGNARVRSATEVNRRRERAYQAALARGSFLSRFTSLDTNRGNTATTAVAGMIGGVAGVATGVGYAALSGQGAIQGEARQNVLRSRRNQARPEVSGAQRARTLAKLARLQQDQLRVHQTLSPVAANTPGTSVGDLSVIDVQNYQALHPGHGMATPGAVIAERNRVADAITATRTQLGI